MCASSAEWLAAGRDTLLAEVQRLSGGKAPDAKSVAEAKGRLAALATRSADRTGVSFAGAALHAAYFDAKFARRGGLLYRLLCACCDERNACSHRLARQLTAAGAGPERPRLRVASIGGGPGTDTAGLFWAERHVLRFAAAAKARRGGGDAAAPPKGGLDVTLYDLERSWRRYTPCLAALLAPRIALDFQPCDVRAPLPLPSPANAADDAAWTADGSGSNKALAAASPVTHVFVFAYVSHETADAASASDWAFYRSLAAAAPPGAVFLFMDVRGRCADVFDAIHATMSAALTTASADADAAPALERFAPTAQQGPPLNADVMVLLKREAGVESSREDDCTPDDADPAPGALAPAEAAAVELQRVALG